MASIAAGLMNAAANRKIQLVGSGVLIAVIACIAFAWPAAAQDARESITLSPTSRTYGVAAGKTLDDKLTVINDGTTAYDFLVYARPYSVQDNRYTSPDFDTAVPNADLYGWVRFAKTKYHVAAGASVEVPYTLTVPEAAAPGGHYGVIFAEIQPPSDQPSGNAVLRKKRVGAIMYATVAGDVKLAGAVAAGDIPFWQLEPPLRTTVASTNTGNTHFADKVKLTVKDVFGNVKYSAAKEYKVLPGTTRTMNLDWDKAPWFGLFRVETEQKFLDKTEKSEGYVLIMPRFIPVALLIIVVAGGVYAVVRRQKK